MSPDPANRNKAFHKIAKPTESIRRRLSVAQGARAWASVEIMGWPFAAEKLPADSSSDSSAPRKKRSLRKFDTTAFTLHEHCGTFSQEVRSCLVRHGVDPDPVAQEERDWAGAQECRKLWSEYKQCGQLFFSSLGQADRKCSAEQEAFRRCNDPAACDAAELALARCKSKRIQMTMSGGKPPMSDLRV